jgi:hypothetical protein
MNICRGQTSMDLTCQTGSLTKPNCCFFQRWIIHSVSSIQWLRFVSKINDFRGRLTIFINGLSSVIFWNYEIAEKTSISRKIGLHKFFNFKIALMWFPKKPEGSFDGKVQSGIQLQNYCCFSVLLSHVAFYFRCFCWQIGAVITRCML